MHIDVIIPSPEAGFGGVVWTEIYQVCGQYKLL
jgi:hypothetical protein